MAALLTAAACVDTRSSVQPRLDVTATSAPAPAAVAATSAESTSAAGWRMPTQISPREASQAGGEETVTVWVPQTGLVRGTRSAVAGLGTPLQPAPGRNRAVEACRKVVQAEAAKLGAREVEAVSAGPERRNDKGQFVGPVRVRITYARPSGTEVRTADMTCVVDAKGRIVDASV